MTPVGHEHQRPDRDENDVSGVGGYVGHDAEEDDDGRDEAARRDRHRALEDRRDVAARLGDADAEHGDEDDAQRGEVRKVLYRRGEHIDDALLVEQTYRLDRLHLHGICRAVDKFAGRGDAHRREDRGERRRHGGKDRKERYRMRQFVAHALNSIEKTVEQRNPLLCFGCHYKNSS
ncbi:hypothetical protein SDC9_181963 [bioreactor metagenome]|uniref:Uncharacterized protein n=1 Tax=bioreactor metagenome TaxID=1076179 RepID=A0A645H8P9_9ZZZZ